MSVFVFPPGGTLQSRLKKKIPQNPTSVLAKCGSYFQKNSTERNSFSRKVTSDLLIVEYPWQCSDLIPYLLPHPLGPKREKGSEGDAEVMCVLSGSWLEMNIIYPETFAPT